MGIVQKSITTLLLISLFCCFILIKMESKSDRVTNWFAIFWPLWVLNCIFFFHGAIKVAHSLRYPVEEYTLNTLKKKAGLLVGITLLFISEVLFCLKLQYFSTIPMFVVMTPLWGVLGLIIVYLIRYLIRNQSCS